MILSSKNLRNLLDRLRSSHVRHDLKSFLVIIDVPLDLGNYSGVWDQFYVCS